MEFADYTYTLGQYKMVGIDIQFSENSAKRPMTENVSDFVVKPDRDVE